ncbi:hypothetical protein K501DRAFT_268541 [Backusella circina FSU 941]|nr:hypothetical protein K501DRAFT_268541 [Backusella circina FSU 941]
MNKGIKSNRLFLMGLYCLLWSPSHNIVDGRLFRRSDSRIIRGFFNLDGVFSLLSQNTTLKGILPYFEIRGTALTRNNDVIKLSTLDRQNYSCSSLFVMKTGDITSDKITKLH